MKKILLSLILTLTLAVTQIGFVAAQSETITGTVQSVSLETDSAGVTTALVTTTDSTGATQTYRLSVETATSLGLVTTDPTTNEPVVDTSKYGTEVTIDPTTVIADEEEAEHPVASALSNFFSETLGVDYDTIMTYHEDGAGFGVIAQALWMTTQLDGDTATFDAIMIAKTTGDYSAITLPDGSTPTNWGQFRKAVLGNKGAAKQNLGAIMSGKADSDTSATGSENGNNGNGGNKGNGNGKSGEDHGKGNGKP